MAKHPSGKPEWQKQQELRAERRSRKKKSPRTFEPGPKDYSIGTLVLELKGMDSAMREVAYDDLMVAQTLRTYFPHLCSTPGARRKTVLSDRIELTGPRLILNQIERELRAGWRRGKLKQEAAT